MVGPRNAESGKRKRFADGDHGKIDGPEDAER